MQRTPTAGRPLLYEGACGEKPSDVQGQEGGAMWFMGGPNRLPVDWIPDNLPRCLVDHHSCMQHTAHSTLVLPTLKVTPCYILGVTTCTVQYLL